MVVPLVEQVGFVFNTYLMARACVLLLLVVLRFSVDPEIVLDGRGTSFPALGGRLRAREGVFGGGPGAPRTLFEQI
jgi:hypothetical protein